MRTPRPGLALALNVVGYQLVWFSCVAGAGRGLPWLGPLVAAAFAIVTLATGGRRTADLRALMLALPIGFAIDSGFAASGWLSYAQPWPWPDAAPVWILALWASFALTLNHSLSFLHGRPLLAAGLGLLGGPLAYWAAAGTFGAVTFGTEPVQVLFALGVCWALALPLILALNDRITWPGASVA